MPMDFKYKWFARRAEIIASWYSLYDNDPTRMNHDVWLCRMGLMESWFLKYNNVCGDSPGKLSE